jgi:hypothetical protein
MVRLNMAIFGLCFVRNFVYHDKGHWGDRQPDIHGAIFATRRCILGLEVWFLSCMGYGGVWIARILDVEDIVSVTLFIGGYDG